MCREASESWFGRAGMCWIRVGKRESPVESRDETPGQLKGAQVSLDCVCVWGWGKCTVPSVPQGFTVYLD